MTNNNKNRNYINEVLSGPEGVESFLVNIPDEAKYTVENFLTWIVRSGSAWQDLKNWRSDVRTSAFVLADKDGMSFM